MREGLTKILYGMQFNGAPAARIDRLEADLVPLGGPDPDVKPLTDEPTKAEIAAERFFETW